MLLNKFVIKFTTVVQLLFIFYFIFSIAGESTFTVVVLPTVLQLICQRSKYYVLLWVLQFCEKMHRSSWWFFYMNVVRKVSWQKISLLFFKCWSLVHTWKGAALFVLYFLQEIHKFILPSNIISRKYDQVVRTFWICVFRICVNWKFTKRIA